MSNVPRVIEVRSAGAQVTEWLASHEEDVEGENEEHDIMWLPNGRYRWDKALGTGYFVVVKLLWQQALQNALSVASISDDDWAGYAQRVLLSMQKDVLMAVAGGNLANLYWGQTNKAVCDLFHENSAWMANQVNSGRRINGMSPWPGAERCQLRKLSWDWKAGALPSQSRPCSREFRLPAEPG